MPSPKPLPSNAAENRMPQKLPGRVYYVSSPEDQTVLYAMDVTVQNGYVSWFDGTKERIMRLGEVKDANPEHFVFQRAEDRHNETYIFVPMTLELYRQYVKSRLVSQKDFDSEEDMLNSIELTRKSAW